jgi:DNA primase
MPVVVFPHRDWEGDLRGVRYRSLRRGNRWSEKGSRFEQLYGAWLDRGERDVLLCEGETDTVFAAWQLQGLPVDVMGLASGAAQKPPSESIERLTGRSVWLAFDGDMAGHIATTRWANALDGIAAVRVVELPDGEDVCSVGRPIQELMRWL